MCKSYTLQLDKFIFKTINLKYLILHYMHLMNKQLSVFLYTWYSIYVELHIKWTIKSNIVKFVFQSGPQHQSTFDYRCTACGETVIATAHSKKEAKQEAAKLMLYKLAQKGYNVPPPYGSNVPPPTTPTTKVILFVIFKCPIHYNKPFWLDTAV